MEGFLRGDLNVRVGKLGDLVRSWRAPKPYHPSHLLRISCLGSGMLNIQSILGLTSVVNPFLEKTAEKPQDEHRLLRWRAEERLWPFRGLCRSFGRGFTGVDLDSGKLSRAAKSSG
jgi:hypothetical protein